MALSSIEIAQSVTPKPIRKLLEELNIGEEFADLYGRNKAKVHLNLLKEINHRKNGKYIVVAGITPTPLGEGKSTACIGISQSLGAHLHKKVFTCMRQPSMGPTFGIKGGAAGGGYSQVIPMDEFNLHLTGDIHAVSIANNLLCAQIDTRIYHEKTCSTKTLFEKLFKQVSKSLIRRIEKVGLDPENLHQFTEIEREKIVRLNIDPATIVPNRVVDVNDRMLRGVTIGLGEAEGGKYVRKTKVDIAVSCEIMAILALAKNLADLHDRLARMVVALAETTSEPITVDDLGLTGALTVLLKDALCPTLMQTLEGTPVFVHSGPFANIAHGNSSIVADQLALKLVGEDGFVLTESGFGSDMGLEKFVNIKCRQSGLRPDCVVLVATCRALKMHGEGSLAKGVCNLEAHIAIATKHFNIPVVVCVNKHYEDSPDELEFVKSAAIAAGANFAEIGDHFAQGGKGAIELAKRIVQVTSSSSSMFRFSYEITLPLRVKVQLVCKEIYGAAGVSFSAEAETDLNELEKKFGNFSICMAKTQYSLSHDPLLLGRPEGFVVPVSRCRASVGAGFVYLLIGPIMTMPGLPIRPAFYDIEIDTETGRIDGMF